MSGTSIKCMKCGRIFRQIHGSTTEDLHRNLREDEKEMFRGNDFFCCGKEHLRTLHDLGMTNELIQLQRDWVNIMIRLRKQ
jgi:hypothetical protein